MVLILRLSPLTRTAAAHIAKPFLEKLNTPNLYLYVDDKMKLMRAFGVRGMPTVFSSIARAKSSANLKASPNGIPLRSKR